MKKCRLFIMMLAVVLCSSNWMYAQNEARKGDRKAPTTEEIAEMQIKRLQKTLKLDDETKEKFAPLYKEYFEELSKCRPDWQAAGKKSERTDAEVKEQVKKNFVIQRAAIDVKEKYYEQFAEFLNGEQLEKLFNPFPNQGMRPNNRPQRERPQFDNGQPPMPEW